MNPEIQTGLQAFEAIRSHGLTQAEVAVRLGITRKTVTRWCAKGVLTRAERAQFEWALRQECLEQARGLNWTLAALAGAYAYRPDGLGWQDPPSIGVDALVSAFGAYCVRPGRAEREGLAGRWAELVGTNDFSVLVCVAPDASLLSMPTLERIKEASRMHEREVRRLGVADVFGPQASWTERLERARARLGLLHRLGTGRPSGRWSNTGARALTDAASRLSACLDAPTPPDPPAPPAPSHSY